MKKKRFFKADQQANSSSQHHDPSNLDVQPIEAVPPGDNDNARNLHSCPIFMVEKQEHVTFTKRMHAMLMDDEQVVDDGPEP